MTEPEALRAVLIRAQQCYDELERVLAPMREAMTDLEQDWSPRGEPFWQHVLAALTPLRQKVDACLALYRQQECPTQLAAVAALFSAVSIEQSCVLFYLRSRIEEVGLRLTSYRHRASFAEKHLRQRQWVLQGMRDLEDAGQKALQKGRIWIVQVLEGQHTSVVPCSASETDVPGAQQLAVDLDATRTTTVKRRRAANKSRSNNRSDLYLVRRQEQEDQSGPVSSG